MAAVGFVAIFLVLAVVAPLALYWFVRAEDPDPDRTTSWSEARRRASENTLGDGSDGGREARRRDRDDYPDDDRQGDHWS